MNVFKKNLSWIFFGNIVHAIFQFALNIYCARQFGSSDYGVINYCVSLVAFFTAVGTLGFNGVITKFFAQEEENAGKFLGTTILARLVFSVLSIILLQIIIAFDEAYSPTLAIIVLCQSAQIMFGVADLFVYWFRYKNQAKHVAIIRLVAFAMAALWRFVAIYFHSLEWYSMGISMEIALFSIFLYWLFRREYHEHRLSFDKNCLTQIFRLSYPFIFSAILVTIYGQTDKIMLKSMVDFESVGLYSVSLTLAGAISIIPAALIEGFRPEIMIYKVQNEAKYKHRLRQLYGIVFWICVLYCVFITILSEPLIRLLYGEQYLAAVSSLSIIVWYTSFSYFGAINNMYMVAENKTFWVQIITLVGAVLNVALNFFFSPLCGIVGAAIASLITQIFGNYILMFLIKPLRGGFKLLNEGIIVKWVKQ